MKNIEEVSTVACKGCGNEVVPKFIREPLVFAKGIQVSGKYYRCCPECLKDVDTGEDRQSFDFCDGRTKQLNAIKSSLVGDYSLKGYAVDTLLGVALFIVGLILILLVFGFIASFDENIAALIYWFKGTKLGYWYYTNFIK